MFTGTWSGFIWHLFMSLKWDVKCCSVKVCKLLLQLEFCTKGWMSKCWSKRNKCSISFYFKSNVSHLNVIQNLQCTLYARLKIKAHVIEFMAISCASYKELNDHNYSSNENSNYLITHAFSKIKSCSIIHIHHIEAYFTTLLHQCNFITCSVEIFLPIL